MKHEQTNQHDNVTIYSFDKKCFSLPHTWNYFVRIARVWRICLISLYDFNESRYTHIEQVNARGVIAQPGGGGGWVRVVQSTFSLEANSCVPVVVHNNTGALCALKETFAHTALGSPSTRAWIEQVCTP